MAFTFDVNRASLCADGAFHVYYLKEALKTAGWTVIDSGDGSGGTYVAGTDVITSPNSGAGGFDNTDAWICLQQPTGGAAPYAGTRQVVFQCGAGGGNDLRYAWRITYSPGGTANIAASSATQSPAFTDSVLYLGGGTPAAPTYANMFVTAAATLGTTEILAGGVTEKFGFFMSVIGTVANTSKGAMFFDPLTSYIATDAEPYQFGISPNPLVPGDLDDVIGGFANSPGAITRSIFNGDVAGYLCGMMGNPCGVASLGSYASFVRIDPNGNIDTVKPYYVRPTTVAAPGGWKGISTLFRWRCANKPTKDTYTVSTAKDRMIVDELVINWDGSVPT